ncbi:MAG: DNA gyrase inhibitor YacG [Nitrospirota bacterium]
MQIACPVCKNKTTWEENPWKPFCSERCKLLDLGKWISEEYKIEGKETSGSNQNTEIEEKKK